MNVFNVYSYFVLVIVGALIIGLTLWFALRNMQVRPRMVIVGGVLVAYLIGMWAFNAINQYTPTDVRTVEEVEQRLNSGRPVFVMLYSNYCMGCMASVPAVRDLQPQLEDAGINLLLLNVHAEPGSQLLDRFGFRITPTYIVYTADGREVLRTNVTPSLEQIETAAAG